VCERAEHTPQAIRQGRMRWVALLAAVAGHCLAAESPYPSPKAINSSTLLVIGDDALSGPEQLLVGTLQGITSRARPLVFRNSTGGARLWLAELQQTWGVSVESVPSVEALLKRSRPAFEGGYVLCNASSGDSVLAAVTASSLLGAVAVDASLQTVADSAGLEQVFDARNQTSMSVIRLLNGTSSGAVLSSRVAVLQAPSKLCCLWDYALFATAGAWYDPSMSDPTSRAILDSMQPGWALLGWGGSEKQTVTAASTRAGWVNAADWARNLAPLAGFRAAEPMAQPNALPPSLPPAPARKHTVAFLMTDGDNLQWLLNDFATGPAWWGSPQRGTVPMGWTLSAALPRVAAPVATMLYGQATVRSGPGSACDVFVAGPSGAGYAYPDLMGGEALATFAAASRTAARAAGLGVVNVLGSTYSAAAADAMAEGMDGVLWYEFDPYDGLHGSVSFSSQGVPVVGARFMLWEGYDTPESIAAKVATLSTDPTSPEAYSLVVVHAWSSNVTQAAMTAKLLEAQSVDVVCPDELVSRVRAFVRHA